MYCILPDIQVSLKGDLFCISTIFTTHYLELVSHAVLMKAILSVNDAVSQNSEHYELVSQIVLTKAILGLISVVSQSSENYELISHTIDKGHT